MCGRYTLRCADESELIDSLPFDGWSETRIQFRPRYNIAPGQKSPIVHLRAGKPVLQDGLWGFARPGGGISVNARSETADKTAIFRDAFRDGRCLVPADGFFEWRREGKVNQPYLFQAHGGKVFLMAGLCERGHYVVLTRPASEQVREIHDRMPVLLDTEAARRWLDDADMGKGLPLTRRAVSTRVNRVEHDDPDCIEEVAQQDFGFD
jgi:putative SOS response-associated peptidase YedK